MNPLRHFLSVGIAALLLSAVTQGQTNPTIIRPNGSEELLIGTATTIEWAGISASDTVALSYSTDAGFTWLPITSQATGLSYSWVVPNTPGNHCRLRVLPVSKEQPRFIKSFKPMNRKLNSLSFSSNDSLVLLTGILGDSAMVIYWRSEKIYRLQRTQTGPTTITSSFSYDGILTTMTFSDSRTAVLPSDKREWRGGYVQLAKMDERCGEFSRDGKRVGLAFDSLVQFNDVDKLIDINLGDATPIYTYRVPNTTFCRVTFSPADSLIAIGREDGKIDLLRGDTYTLVRTIDAYTKRGPYSIRRMSFSQDGRQLILLGSSPDRVNIIDVNSGELVGQADNGSGKIQDAVVGRNDSLLVLALPNDTISIWSLRKMHEISQLPQPVTGRWNVDRVALSNDGTMLAVGEQGTISIWELPTGQGPDADESDADWSIAMPPPPIVAELSVIDFGKVKIGRVADTLVTAVVRNRGSQPVMIRDVVIAGFDYARFDLPAKDPSMVLQPDQTYNLELRYVPKTTGPSRAWVQFVYDGSPTPVAVELWGEGVIPSSVPVSDEEAISAATSAYLFAPQPNPAHTAVRFEFHLPHSGNARLVLVNLLGQEVTTLLSQPLENGRQAIESDVSTIPAGTYQAILYTSEGSMRQPIQIIR
jgi:WD40 repeat protein